MNLDASFAPSLFQNSNGTTAAASTDNPVGYWADMSGLGNHATQATSGARPLLKLNNQSGLPGLYLDGTNGFITASIAGLQSLSALTVMMVCKPVAAAASDANTAVFFAFGNVNAASGIYPAISGLGVNSSSGVLSGEYLACVVDKNGVTGRMGISAYRRAASECIVIAGEFTSSGTTVYANNSRQSLDLASGVTASTSSSPSATGYTADNDLHIGALRLSGVMTPSPAMTVHQVLVYNRALTFGEQTSLRNYLSAKWGLTPAAVPQTIAGLQLWLDAADASSLFDATSGGSLVASDGQVRRWQDKSGNAAHATIASNGPTRKTGVRNGRDVLRFDGVNNLLQTGAISGLNSLTMTVFVVASQRVTGANGTALALGYGDFSATSVEEGRHGLVVFGSAATLVAFSRNSTGSFVAVNSASRPSFTANELLVAGYTIDSSGALLAFKNAATPLSGVAGSGASVIDTPSLHQTVMLGDNPVAVSKLDGDICEVLIYNTRLLDAERNAVISYLMSKWGIA
jgi:hypothetical protein